VNFYLGRVAWKLLDSAESIKRYELFIAIAKGLGDEEGIIQAAGNLLEVIISYVVYWMLPHVLAMLNFAYV
jgi:hypothetical protein